MHITETWCGYTSLNLSHDKAPLGEMAWVEFALGFEHAFKLRLHADRVAQGEEKT